MAVVHLNPDAFYRALEGMSSFVGAPVTQGATYSYGREGKRVVLVSCGESVLGPDPSDPSAWSREKWMFLARKLEEKVQLRYCERLRDIRGSLADLVEHPFSSTVLASACDILDEVHKQGVDRGGKDEQSEQHETHRDDAVPCNQGMQGAPG